MISYRKFRTALALVLSLLFLASSAIGATSALAEPQTLGNANLQAAFERTNKVALESGFSYTQENEATNLGIEYSYVFAPGNKILPANLALRAKVFGDQTTNFYALAEGNPLDKVALKAENILQYLEYNWINEVYPERAGWVIGKPGNDGWTTTAYSVTWQGDSMATVEVESESSIDFSNYGQALVRDRKTVFELTDGLITKVSISSSAASSMINGDYIFSFDRAAIERNFAEMVPEWKSAHFDSTTLALAMKLTKAFLTSKQAAAKYGMTISEATKPVSSFSMYDPKSKRSVSAGYQSGKAVSGVSFSDSTTLFDSMWATVFLFEKYFGKAIKYSAKTRTYTLDGEFNSSAKIQLDAKGRIITFSSSGSPYSSQSRKIRYFVDKALWGKWGNFGPKTQALITWITTAKVQLASSKVQFTKRGNTVRASSSSQGASSTFDIKGMKASTVSAIFKQLGYVLK